MMGQRTIDLVRHGCDVHIDKQCEGLYSVLRDTSPENRVLVRSSALMTRSDIRRVKSLVLYDAKLRQRSKHKLASDY
jgi:hypothetical protein